MDPTKTLLNALTDLVTAGFGHNEGQTLAQHDHDYQSTIGDAVGGLRDLADWLEKGGFPPTVIDWGDDLGDGRSGRTFGVLD